MPDFIAQPLSLYSIPLVFATAFYPVTQKTRLLIATRNWDNIHPRATSKKLQDDASVPKDVAEKVLRYEGAHLNGMENAPLWIGAVLAGHIAGIDHETLNIASAAYLALRLLYNYLYVNQKTKAMSLLRSTTFFASLPIPLYLYVKAAKLVRARGI